MTTYSAVGPDGKKYSLEGPPGASDAEVMAELQKQYTAQQGAAAKPKGGFMPALKAGFSNLKGDLAGLAGRAGLMSIADAEQYQQEQAQVAKNTFKPTDKGWLDAPGTKIAELAGGSAAYMAAPVLAGGAAAVAGAPALLGAGVAGLTSAAQFTGSNLSRQQDEGKKLADTDLKGAALAAVPQAALDMIGFKMIPGIRTVFKAAGKEITEEAAARLAQQTLRQKAAEYAAATGKAMTGEGVTEAAQQVFERMQAGLNIKNPEAYKEYWDNFVGGAVLGGTIAPVGHMRERGQQQTQAQASINAKNEAAAKLAQEQAAAQAAQEEAFKQTPAYQDGIAAKYKAFLAQEAQAKAALGAKPDDNADPGGALAWQAKAAEVAAMRKEGPGAELIRQYSEIAPAVQAREAAAAKAAADAQAAKVASPEYQAQLKAQHDAGEQGYTQAHMDLQAATAAGDTGAISDALASIEQHQKLQQEALQAGYNKVAPVETPAAPSEQALLERIARLTGSTDAKGKAKPGEIVKLAQSGDLAGAKQLADELAQVKKDLKSLQDTRTMGEQARQRATEGAQMRGADLAQAEQPAQTTTAPNAPQAVGLDRLQEPQGPQFPQGERQPPSNATPQRVPKAPGKDTTAQSEQGLFGDLEPGGNAGTPVENLRAQIETLLGRPSMPDATKAQLTNYQRALENPNLPPTALEQITDNVRSVAYAGAGQGESVTRKTSPNEVRAQIAAIDSRIKTTGQELVAAQQAVRDAATQQEKFDRSTELGALRKRAQELVAQRNDLRNGGVSVNLTPYERQEKVATTLPPRSMSVQQGPEVGPQPKPGMDQSTAVAGPATDTQLKNSKKMVDGHPYAAGREVTYVNPEPATKKQTTFTEDVGADDEVTTRAETTEQVADKEDAAPKDRGLARIERGTQDKTEVKQTRAGPDDRALNEIQHVQSVEEMRSTPEHKQTMDLWDPVFGEGSKARTLIVAAEQGLVAAKGAVRAADTALVSAQYQLQQANKTLTKALATDVTSAQRKALVGDEHLQQNKVSRAQERAADVEKARGIEAQGVARDLGNQQTEARKQIADATRATEDAKAAVVKAEQVLRKANSAFQAEWARLQTTGEITPDFVAFVGERSMKEDLAKAREDFSALLKMYEGSAEGATAEHLVTGIDTLAANAKTAASAQELIKSMVPEIDRLLGPKAAKLMDTIIRLQVARNIVGKGMELKQALDLATAARAAAEAAATKTTAAATKKIAKAEKTSGEAVASANDRLAALHAKVEVAQAVAQAEQKRLEELQQKIEALTDQEGEGAQAARADVAVAQTKVEEATKALDDAKKTADERIKEAGANVDRAKETRDMLFENERALREGRRMPLQEDLTKRTNALQKAYDSFDEESQQMLGTTLFEVLDVGRDAATLQAHIKGLDALEEKMAKLLQQHTSDFTEVQDQIASMRDANALLASDVYDPEGTDAQRMVDKASVVAQQRHLGEEIARTMTQRDKALGSIKRAFDAHVAAWAGPQTAEQWDTHAKRNTLLLERHEEMTKFFAERLADLRNRQAALEPERNTAPDTEMRTRMAADLDIMRGLQDRMQYQLESTNAHIDGIRARRDAAIKDARSEGNMALEALRALGLSDRERGAPALRKQLMESLAAQRSAETAADKSVAAAEKAMHDAKREAQRAPIMQRADTREAFRLAKQAYLKSVADRANLHDQLVSLERMQLSITEELMKAKEAPVETKITTAEAPVTEAPAEAWGDMAASLARGDTRMPEIEALDPEFDAFKQQVDGLQKAGQLRRWLGTLKAQHDTLIEEAQNRSPQTLTMRNARSLGPESNKMNRLAAHGFAKATALQKQAMLFDRMNYIQDRIDEVNGNVPKTVERIASTQPSPGRRGPLMKKEIVASDKVNMTGSPESRAGENKVGNKNRPTEKKIVASPTAKQVVEQANKDTGPSTQLRIQMERAQLERDVDTTRAARAAAQERYDAVMAAPRASDKAKENVTAALDAAKKAAAAADKALVKGTEVANKPNAERKSTSVSAAAQEAAYDGRILDVAKDLAANGSTAEVRADAARLLPLLMRTKLVVDENVTHNGESVAGKYNPETNTITMHPDGLTEEDIIHEMSHAATDSVLLADPATLTPTQREGRTGLENMWKGIEHNPNFIGEHGATSVREFAAEVYSNEAFRAKLDAMGKPLSLLQRFKNFVRKMLGMPTDPSGRAKDFVDKVLSPSRKIKGTATPSVFRGASPYTTEAAKFGQEIAPHVNKLEQIKANKGSLALAMEQKLVDFRASLRAVSRLGSQVSGDQVKYSVLMADKGLQNMSSVAEHGAMGLETDSAGIVMAKAGHSSSAKDVLEAINKLPGASSAEKLDTAQGYLTALRARDVGYDTLDFADPVGAAKRGAIVIKEVESNPAMLAAMKEVQRHYQSLNQGLVRFLAQTDTLPKDVTDKMLADKNYIPFYRDNGDLMLPDGGYASVGDIRNMPFLHALNKGDAKLMPFEQSMFKNIATLTNMAMQNMAARHTAYHLQDLGKATKVMQVARGEGPAVNDGRVIRFRQKPDAGETGPKAGHRYVIIDTKGTAAEHIPNDLLAQAVAGVYSTTPSLLKAGAWASDILRAGVTRMPTYMISQLIKDPANAAMLGNLKADPFSATVKTMGNFMEHLTSSSAEDRTLTAHGVLHSNIFSGGESDLKKIAMQIAGGNQSKYRQTLAALDKIAMSADAATRIQGYRDVIHAGGSEARAVIHAMEMQNFNKRGASLSVQMIGRLVPFFNAQIQGLNVLVKSATGKMPSSERLASKEAFYRRALGMTAMALLYCSAMEDDDDWNRLSMYTKMSHIPVPGLTLGGEQVHLPTPFETGMLFWSMPVAFYHALKENFSEADWRDVRKVIQNQIPGNGSIMPQIAKGAVDVARNYNSYFGTPIETPIETKAVTERFNDSTPEMVKMFSRHLVDAGVDLSPVQIDYLANAYLGQLPHIVGTLTNTLFETRSEARDTGDKPESTYADNPLLSRFVTKASESRAVNTAYDMAKQAMQTKASVKSMRLDGRGDQAMEYAKEQIAQYGTMSHAGKFIKSMGYYKRATEKIRDNPLMSAEQKREALDQLAAQKDKAAQDWIREVPRAGQIKGAEDAAQEQ